MIPKYSLNNNDYLIIHKDIIFIFQDFYLIKIFPHYKNKLYIFNNDNFVIIKHIN